MKTENNLRNKTLFFTQYLFQEVLSNSITLNENNIEILRTSDLSCIDINQNWFLSLKSIANINDIDAVEINKKFLNMDSQLSTIDIKTILMVMFIIPDTHSSRVLHVQFSPIEFVQIADFLKSKGYVLPWKDLSIKDLIEYNWIQLK